MAERWYTKLIHLAASVTGLASWGGVTVGGLLATGAGFWAYLDHYGALGIILVAVLMFAAFLHIITSVVYLVDRAKSLSPSYVRADYDCSWALNVGTPQLSKDPNNPLAEYQFRVHVTNTSDYPIKYIVKEATTVIENRVPNDLGNRYSPGVLARLGGTTRASFTPYAKGMLPQSGAMEGTGRIVILFGHPAVGYSRKMTKEFRIKCSLSPSWDRTKIIPGGLLPTEIAFSVEDEEPFRDQAAPQQYGKAALPAPH